MKMGPMRYANVLVAVLVIINTAFVIAFLEQPQTSRRVPTQKKWGLIDIGKKQKTTKSIIHGSTASPSDEGDSAFSSGWMEDLRLRQLEITREKGEHEQKWRNAECSSGVKVSLPDWVRRLDVDYPLVACGTASGKVYVANLESGTVIAESSVPEKEERKEELKNIGNTLEQLYGNYDGGGTIAIAFKGDVICEAGRDGGVQIWGLDGGSTRLLSLGRMKALEGHLVTSLHLDEEYLWAGTADGQLKAFPLDSDMPLALQTRPDLTWKFRSSIMSFSLRPEVNLGVVSTSDGCIELISTEDDMGALCSFYPPLDDDVISLSTTLVAHSEEDDQGVVVYSIAVGCSDGTMYLQKLNMDEDGEVDEFRPFGVLYRLKPPHSGAVKCLTSPIPGLLVSGAHDGSVRVWDVEDGSCLYQFVGYKVWLGSMWTDGSRLVSDGSDNTVIVHDFEKPADENHR